MNPTFVWKLGFYIWKTNVEIQKIDAFSLEIFGIVIAEFQVEDKGSRLKFFPDTFLIVDIQFEMFLKISFLKINNANVLFGERILI